MKNKYIIIFILLHTLYAKAQQDPMYSQYWINAVILNPAQVAADGNTTLNVTGRYQWVNLEGAPKTTSVSFGGMPMDRLGVGGSYIYDEVGPVKSNNLNGDVAYHLPISKKWTATLGTRLSVMTTAVNLTTLYTDQQNDPAFTQNLNSGAKPNVGFGILVHNDKFYFGYAQPKTINYDLSTSAYMNVKIVTHRFAYVGYNYTVNKDLELRPSALLKQVTYTPLQLDLNLVADFYSRFDVGVSYRTGGEIGAMFGMSPVKNFRFYYCYDYPLSAIAQISKQTHQLSLTYKFAKKIKRVNSPRYFE